MLSPLVPTLDHYLLISMYAAFTNIMACRVFRGVALGVMNMGDIPPHGLSTGKIAVAMELDPLSSRETLVDVEK